MKYISATVFSISNFEFSKTIQINPFKTGFAIKTMFSIALLLVLFTTTNVLAATFTVSTLADNEANGCSLGQCTLREAVNDANFFAGSDTINFQAGLNGTITLTGGHLSVTSNITINGPGARNISVSGNNNSRVFVVSGSSTNANISGLTITGGNAQPILLGATLVGDGGGILNANGATLNLTEVNVSGNSATSLGGGIATRALLLVVTTTNISRSLISNNQSVVGGGGVSNLGTDLISGAFTTISNSTITNNNALAEGGGISNTAATMNLVNNTISHNQSLVAGGGIVNVGGVIVGAVNMRNNILAQNIALVGINLVSSDALGIFNSLGNNLVGNNLDVSVSFSASLVIGNVPQPNVNADIVGSIDIGFQIVNPLLGSLGNNGGQTDSRILNGGSPAIERGNNCVVTNTCSSFNLSSALTTDQRGAGFNRSVDGDGDSTLLVDIGAFESQSVPTGITLTVTNLNDTTPNGCSALDCTLREAVLDANLNPGPDSINFTPGLNGTIPLSPAFGQLEISSDISIDGPGATIMSVSGQGTNRVFMVSGVGTTANIKGISIKNGNAQTIGTVVGDGGGVLNISGSNLNLVEVDVSENNAQNLGGGIATLSISGAITNTYITRSLVSSNQSQSGNGGISNVASSNLFSSATTTATNTTITLNNTAAEGGGIGNIGGIVNLINDTITDNTSSLTGGGAANIGGILGLGFINVRNTIIAQNNPIYVSGVLTVSDDAYGVFNTLGNNVIGNNLNSNVSFPASTFSGSIPLPNINNDKVGAISGSTSVIDPKLGPLQNNGGQTSKRSVLAGSPAIDSGNNCVQTDTCINDPSPSTLPEPLLTDQRGTGYPRIAGSNTESGAYEQQLAPTAANVTVSGRVTDEGGNPISRATLTLTDLSGTIRSVTTNQFGFFRFDEVRAGETYIAQVVHKKYAFAPQVVSVADDISDLNFTAGQANRK